MKRVNESKIIEIFKEGEDFWVIYGPRAFVLRIAFASHTMALRRLEAGKSLRSGCSLNTW